VGSPIGIKVKQLCGQIAKISLFVLIQIRIDIRISYEMEIRILILHVNATGAKKIPKFLEFRLINRSKRTPIVNLFRAELIGDLDTSLW